MHSCYFRLKLLGVRRLSNPAVIKCLFRKLRLLISFVYVGSQLSKQSLWYPVPSGWHPPSPVSSSWLSSLLADTRSLLKMKLKHVFRFQLMLFWRSRVREDIKICRSHEIILLWTSEARQLLISLQTCCQAMFLRASWNLACFFSISCQNGRLAMAVQQLIIEHRSVTNDENAVIYYDVFHKYIKEWIIDGFSFYVWICCNKKTIIE